MYHHSQKYKVCISFSTLLLPVWHQFLPVWLPGDVRFLFPARCLYVDKVKLCLTEKREEFQFTFLLRFLHLSFRPDTFSSYSGLPFGALFIYFFLARFFLILAIFP